MANHQSMASQGDERGQRGHVHWERGGLFVGVCTLIGLLVACDSAAPPATSLDPELVFYDFAEDMPPSLLAAFEKEYGVTVTCLDYQSPEEASARIREGLAYDVAFLENQSIPPLIQAGLLAEIDLPQIPNFKNVSANFRDLAFDPGNRYSIPIDYGTTGLLVRTDLIDAGPSHWADLWDPRYAGRIGLRAQPREIVGMTLVSLGHDFNSEDPQALDAALQRLLVLRRAVVMVDIEAGAAVERLLRGEITILHGYPEDYSLARARHAAVVYILPREGAPLWGDSVVIAATSPRKRTAEVFIDFLLRPEIDAHYVNEKKFASSNAASLPFIAREIREDPVIYPADQDLRNSHLILPLTPAGEARYAEIWSHFMDETP